MYLRIKLWGFGSHLAVRSNRVEYARVKLLILARLCLYQRTEVAEMLVVTATCEDENEISR